MFHFSLPVSDWHPKHRKEVSFAIGYYLSEHGVLLSGNTVEWALGVGDIEPFENATTYHIKGNTVLIRSTRNPWRDYEWYSKDKNIQRRYNVEIFVEGEDKSKLIEELKVLLTRYMLHAKV